MANVNWLPKLSESLLLGRFAQKICIHNPALLGLGFQPHSFNILHEFPEITRYENFIFGSEIGSPIDIDFRIIDVLNEQSASSIRS